MQPMFPSVSLEQRLNKRRAKVTDLKRKDQDLKMMNKHVKNKANEKEQQELVPTFVRNRTNIVVLCECLSREYPFLWTIKGYRIVPYRTVPYRTVPYRTVPYRTVPYRTVPYRTVPYRTVPYRTVPYRIIPVIPVIHSTAYNILHSNVGHLHSTNGIIDMISNL